MSDINNPLKQYFRRPAIYLKLPSGGKGYPPGSLTMPETGELPVYPMTAIDEITAKTPDALFNGTAIYELIKSCVPDMKDPWSVSSVDLDATLVAIRAAAGSNSMEVESTCPACSNVSAYGLDLISLLGNIRAGDYDTELVIGDLAFKFRPLVFKEMNEANMGMFEAQKILAAVEIEQDEENKAKLTQRALQDITNLTIKILAKTIVYIRTPNTVVDQKDYILDFLTNCDKITFNTIRDHNGQLRSASELKPFDIKCINCNNEYKQPFTLNVTDFFG